MKIVLLIGVALLIAATIFADYKWRRWMATRRREHDVEHDRRP
jgi:hypothetical protein